MQLHFKNISGCFGFGLFSFFVVVFLTLILLRKRFHGEATAFRKMRNTLHTIHFQGGCQASEQQMFFFLKGFFFLKLYPVSQSLLIPQKILLRTWFRFSNVWKKIFSTNFHRDLSRCFVYYYWELLGKKWERFFYSIVGTCSSPKKPMGLVLCA